MKLAKGVFGRYYGSGERSLQVHFTFRGVRCRETMPGLDPDVKNHVRFAENTLAAIHRDIDKGTFSYTAYFPESKRARIFGHAVSTRTIQQIGKSWLADMKRSLPASTYDNYEGIVERFVYPAIGDLRARDVTVDRIRDMFRDANIALKTARNYSIPLRAIFVRALDDDDIERNPMARINIKSLIPREKHKTAYEVDPFDQAEIDAILEVCRQHRPAWLNYWTLAFYSGLRTSEQFGLEWRDVDWRHGTVRIERAVVMRHEKEPKTETSVRDVLLPDQAIAALKRQRAVTELAGGKIFVHPRDGEPLTSYRVTDRVFDFLQRQAGVRRRNEYQTRHAYASNMLSQGANPLFVANQLGHKHVETVFRFYGRYIPQGDPLAVAYGSVKNAREQS